MDLALENCNTGCSKWILKGSLFGLGRSSPCSTFSSDLTSVGNPGEQSPLLTWLGASLLCGNVLENRFSVDGNLSMLSNCGHIEKHLRVLWTAIFTERTDAEAEAPVSLATWCKDSTHWKRHWLWEKLRVGEGGNRMRWLDASPTQWTWVWANSGRWSRTGKPGVLQSMGSQSQTWLRMRWLDALLTQWKWVWANSGRWWRTGNPGALQSVGSQRVRHDLVTEQQPVEEILSNYEVYEEAGGKHSEMCKGHITKK